MTGITVIAMCTTPQAMVAARMIRATVWCIWNREMTSPEKTGTLKRGEEWGWHRRPKVNESVLRLQQRMRECGRACGWRIGVGCDGGIDEPSAVGELLVKRKTEL